MAKAHLSLQAVARATGLSGHVLRAWEKRYGAVRPARSKAGQRRYTDADVQRLILLERATRAGHPIGTIVGRPDAELQGLLHGGAGPKTARVIVATEEEFREGCIRAVRAMDETALARSLERALMRLGYHGLLARVIAPLAEEIGEQWRQGEITAAHEHFFTAVARTFLGTAAQQFAPAADAPALIAATPAGQYHELGAFMAAVLATHLGWRAIYLGPSLPAAEIAAAVVQAQAGTLVLSIVYPGDDPKLAGELRAVRKHLPDVEIVVGGRAALNFRAVLKKTNARLVTNLSDLGNELDVIRAQSQWKNHARR